MAAAVSLVDPYGNPLTRDSLGIASRSDSWVNSHTGIGSYADKTIHGVFAPVWRIFDTELTSLYNGSALAAKVIDRPVEEMFREGYELECDDVDESDLKEFVDYARSELRVDEHFAKASKFGGLYGGFTLVLGADDGQEADEELNEDDIRTFGFLNGIDRRFSYVLDYYSDPLDKRYGEPQHYLTSNYVAGYDSSRKGIRKKTPGAIEKAGGAVGTVHASRVLRFEGVATDQVTMQTLAGWTWSVLQRVYDDLRKFEHSFDSMQYLLSDASQAVLKLRDLHNSISAGQEDKIKRRALLVEELRSVMHGIILDAGGADGKGAESFERSATPFAGIADLLDKCMLRLAASVDMPVTELFGRAASGLNAAAGADSETRKWYDRIRTRQKNVLAPRYERFYSLLAKAKDCPVKLPAKTKDGKPLKFRVQFLPLYTLTDEEQAKADLARAQMDQVYLAEGVVTPEEVALDRAELYPSMDVEAREKALKGGESFDPYENDPDPPPPTPAGTAGGEIPSPSAPIVPPGPEGKATPAPGAKPAPAAKKPKADSKRRRRR